MSRLFATLICLSIAFVAGYVVFLEIATIHEGRIPLAAGGTTLAVVFCIFYFPLAKPIADLIGDKVAASVHRGRHVRAGSGLEELPDAPKPPPCSICGDSRGPICPDCNAKMSDSRKRSIDLSS